MTTAILQAGATDAIGATWMLAYVVIAVASAVLLYYLDAYVRYVLANPDRWQWAYLAVGVGAGLLYGLAGLAGALTDLGWLDVFAEGASLFFILFLALGIREMYFMGPGVDPTARSLPTWVDYLVVAGFVAAWWVGFLFANPWTHVVVAVGWVLASAWAIWYAVRTVQRHEGTGVAALTRHLLPAVLCVAGVVLVDLLGEVGLAPAPVVTAVWVVGTVLVGAFLFNTAVAIRQQGGEVERMYDWTTWRREPSPLDR
ncbi:MAG: hypothetical protein ABEJ23_03155 [Haloarculaceae archaeon]